MTKAIQQCLLLLGVGLCIATHGSVAAEDEVQSKVRALKPNIRKAAERDIEANRGELINYLMGIVDSRLQEDELDGAMITAIRLLGSLRATEAVPLLVRNITFNPKLVFDNDMRIVPPCVIALVKIGSPAVDGIVSRLGSSVTDEELGLFVEVIRSIDGKDLAVARISLLLKKEQASTRKGNLQSLLEILVDGKRTPNLQERLTILTGAAGDGEKLVPEINSPAKAASPRLK